MPNKESILESIKKLLGIPCDTTDFDIDLIIHINTIFSNLHQMGIGPVECFSIKGVEELWSDFLKDNVNKEQIKTYVFLKVKLIFDPPASSMVMEAYKANATELEVRLYTLYGGY